MDKWQMEGAPSLERNRIGGVALTAPGASLGLGALYYRCDAVFYELWKIPLDEYQIVLLEGCSGR
jgi:hypothetical protein